MICQFFGNIIFKRAKLIHLHTVQRIQVLLSNDK